jgi:hypothetical protein
MVWRRKKSIQTFSFSSGKKQPDPDSLNV